MEVALMGEIVSPVRHCDRIVFDGAPDITDKSIQVIHDFVSRRKRVAQEDG
jgi:hypothetical protein